MLAVVLETAPEVVKEAVLQLVLLNVPVDVGKGVITHVELAVLADVLWTVAMIVQCLAKALVKPCVEVIV